RGVVELAGHNMDRRDQFANLGAYLLDMRGQEMDHALEPHRQLAQRRGRADRERLEEIARKLHAAVLAIAFPLGQTPAAAKPLLPAAEVPAHAAVICGRAAAQRGCAVAAPPWGAEPLNPRNRN